MTNKKKTHDNCTMVRFTDDEFAIIERCAQYENLPIAVFVRKLAIEATTKIEAARKDVARATSWTKCIQSKKLLKERKTI
jgi:hypothetical protein